MTLNDLVVKTLPYCIYSFGDNGAEFLQAGCLFCHQTSCHEALLIFLFGKQFVYFWYAIPIHCIFTALNCARPVQQLFVCGYVTEVTRELSLKTWREFVQRQLLVSILPACFNFVGGLLPPPTRQRLCDRSICHSVNRITDECGNGCRPNLAGMGKV